MYTACHQTFVITDLEMLDIGSQCSHSPCAEIDFLPIYCRCHRYFCRAHSSADAHSCTYFVAPTPTDLPPVPLQRCAVDTCTKPSLESFVRSDADGRTPAKCSGCQGSFCAEHRHPQSHSCQPEPTERPKNEAARALLAKNFPTTSKRKVPASRPPTSTNSSTDPAKLLMNMRHRAVPLDPRDKQTALPPSDRLHIKLLCDDNKEMIFWVRKSLGTGRVLDLLADRLGKSSETAPLTLLKISGPNREYSIPCRNDHAFIDEVDDGSIVMVSRCS